MQDISVQRRAVVDEARQWLRTPYHHMGRVKGAGVDCATLLAEVYAAAGVIPRLDISFYPPDWHLHRDAERYLGFVRAYTVEVAPPKTFDFASHEGRALDSSAACATQGDIALWRFGRCYSHGAIVVEWPLVIHAYAGKGCVMEDAARARWLAFLGGPRSPLRRPVKFFSLKAWRS